MSYAPPALNLCRDLFGIGAERPDHYELLGLPPFEGEVPEIRAAAAARLRQLECPPPEFPMEACRRTVADINTARDCLCNPAAREDYDLQLRRAMLLSPQERASSAEVLPAQHEDSGEGGGIPSPGRSGPHPSSSSRPSEATQPTARAALPPDSSPTTGPSADVAANPGADTVGESLRHHPNYEPVRLLAKGRCNEVFEAFEITLHRKVAIKQLDAGVNEQQTSLFWREAQFLAACGHHNVVTILGSDERRGWIITELMAGNVEPRIAKGPMEPDLVRAVLRQALEGLAHFHRQGRIHGEIKPANLLIDDDGYVKLNASPGFQTSDEFRTPLGCQRHVAPELLNPKVFGEVGPAVDFYCLGFTMLELLIGPGVDNLFRGVSGEGKQRDLAWLRWHHSHTETLPSLSQLVPDAPDDLVAVLDRLTAKRVSQRFACAEEALNALEAGPLLRIPVDGDASPTLGRKRVPGAVIKGKPPAHREYAQQQEKSKTLLYQIANFPPVVYLRSLVGRPAIRYLLCGLALLFVVLVLFASSGPRDRHVRIETLPPGATITINGEALGCQTPRDLDLALGHHVLEFDLQGYEKGKMAVDIPARGDAGPYICTLAEIAKTDVPPSGRENQHAPCPVTVDSVPTGAAIRLDGRSVPGLGGADQMETPGQLELTAGSYDLELRMDGYQPLKTTIHVEKGAKNGFSFTLEKVKVELPEPTPDGPETDSPGGTEGPDPTGPEPEGGNPDAPVAPPPATKDRSVAYTWRLPREVSPVERREYFRQARLILHDAWTQSGSEALRTAENAVARAQSIHQGDSRLHFAYGILLQRHHQGQLAETQLETAKELEWQCQRRRAQDSVPGEAPFPAPWRQLARIYLGKRQWGQATGECLDLLRYCVRSHRSVQQRAAGMPIAYDTVTFDILHENVRFVGHAFGYMAHQHPNASYFSVQPLGRTARLLDSKLDEEPYRILFREAFREAEARCAQEAPVANGARSPDGRGGALEDLAFSLELERNLLIEAIEEESDLAIGTIATTARSDGPAVAPFSKDPF